ncbi:MAG: amidohydrolase family protein [Dehalococcoidia bacterium]
MIIDFHTHILPPSFKRQRSNLIKRDATFKALFSDPKAKISTAAELIRAMNQDGIDVAVAMGYGWTDPDVAHEANDYLLDSAERFEGRIIPFCSVHPGWGEDALREIEHCVAGGAKGIGELHPTSQRIHISKDRRMGPMMRLAAKHNLPVVVHGSEPVGHDYPGKGDTHPSELLAFIERFPNNTIVGAHWGGGLAFYALMPEVGKAMANVYFDSATSPFLYKAGIFPAVVKAAGTENVLFGSDFPLVRPKRVAEQALAGLTAKQAKAVLGDNAAALLGL